MSSKAAKFVRFKNQTSFSSEQGSTNRDGVYQGTAIPFVSAILQGILRMFMRGPEKIISSKNPLNLPTFDEPEKESECKKRVRVLDPQGPFLQTWNKIFVVSCLIAAALDPLFLYIPVIDGKHKCLTYDLPLEITASVLRSFIDIFYVLHIIFEFRTGFIAPSSQVCGRGELVDDVSAISKRYLSSYFIIDILSILPLPQTAILFVIPSVKGPVPLVTKEILKYVIFSQFVPRLVRIYPLYEEVTRSSGILIETAWGGAAFNLLCYLLASHVVGAFWYLFAVEREDRCWNDACSKNHECNYLKLYCGDEPRSGISYSFLNSSCPLMDPGDIDDPDIFNFGIFIDALRSRVVESTDFRRKLFYCFWWGLRGVSSVGQNLQTSTFPGEILFAASISIFGLVLFALLIGNMQKYLESTTVRIEEMRVKRRDAEHWMAHRMIPEKIRDRIRRYEQYKWQETRGVEEDKLISNLPKDLRRDIKRHLCMNLLMRVPMFQSMDDQLLDAMCDLLKLVLYTEKSSIIREGDPVDLMLFIMRGDLATATTYGGKTGFFNSANLTAGDFCGDELLTWALDSHSSSNLPISTRTVESLTDVEAFALTSEDLKFVATQFRRLHSTQLQHTFKFYSLQWRTWAAIVIQSAWRRYLKRKHEKCLREAEDRLQNALANNVETCTSLGATIYASRFAVNLLRSLRRRGPRKTRFSSPRVPPIPPQRPPEPYFTA